MAEEILGSYRVLNYNGALDIICHYTHMQSCMLHKQAINGRHKHTSHH